MSLVGCMTLFQCVILVSSFSAYHITDRTKATRYVNMELIIQEKTTYPSTSYCLYQSSFLYLSNEQEHIRNYFKKKLTKMLPLFVHFKVWLHFVEVNVIGINRPEFLPLATGGRHRSGKQHLSGRCTRRTVIIRPQIAMRSNML